MNLWGLIFDLLEVREKKKRGEESIKKEREGNSQRQKRHMSLQ